MKSASRSAPRSGSVLWMALLTTIPCFAGVGIASALDRPGPEAGAWGAVGAFVGVVVIGTFVDLRRRRVLAARYSEAASMFPMSSSRGSAMAMLRFPLMGLGGASIVALVGPVGFVGVAIIVALIGKYVIVGLSQFRFLARGLSRVPWWLPLLLVPVILAFRGPVGLIAAATGVYVLVVILQQLQSIKGVVRWLRSRRHPDHFPADRTRV